MKYNDFIKNFNIQKYTSDSTCMAVCPNHNDKEASLSITDNGGKILMHCFAGCSNEDILEKVNLTKEDLFNNEKQQKPKVDKEYFYRDEKGIPLYKVMRFIPKNFMQARYVNGKWEYKMMGVRYVPYNLPNVIKSDVVYFVEGEKDADNLNAIGLVATTTVGGAASFNKRAEIYKPYFENKEVYIIPDNDDAGRKYAHSIFKNLKNIVKKIKILDLNKEVENLLPKSDISDILSKYGKEKTLKILENLKTVSDFSIYSGQHLNLNIMKNILKNLSISVRYNEITKETEVSGLDKMYSGDSSSELLPAFLSDFCITNNIKYKESDIKNELLLIADANKYNPIQDMLIQNKWDNINRFPVLFEIVGITEDLLSQTLLKKWMYQTSMIVFNGYKEIFGIEGILVFQGTQGIGKTRFIRNMALNPKWFKEGAIIDLNSKDSIIENTKGWIIELGELDYTLRKKQSAFKAFSTSSIDEIRMPYAQKSVKKPRRTSFFASVNPDEFLVDETGNRRFWTIPVKKIDNERLEKLGKDFILQLWVQAYNEIKDTPQNFRLTSEENKRLNERNNSYSEFIPCEEEITLKMDFTGTVREKWTTVELSDAIFDGKIACTTIGKAVNKIKTKYPNLVEIRKTEGGRRYILPIKKSK